MPNRAAVQCTIIIREALLAPCHHGIAGLLSSASVPLIKGCVSLELGDVPSAVCRVQYVMRLLSTGVSGLGVYVMT